MKLTLADFAEALRRAWPRILIVSAVLALAAYGLAERVGPVHEVHFSYLVSLAEREESDEFQFDGYYALQATDLFTTTLAGWLGAPEVVAAAYREAGLVVPNADVRKLSGQVQVEKAAPQLVRVVVRGQSPAQAAALTAGLQQVIADNVQLYHDQGVPALTFRAVALEAQPSIQAAAGEVVAAATFVFSVLLLINGVLLWRAAKEVQHNEI